MKRLLPKNEFARNVFTLITGTTIAQAIPIAISPLLTRLYAPENYGIFALIMAPIGVLSAAATGRYDLAVMLPDRDEDSDALVILSVSVAAALGLLTLLIIIVFNKSIIHALGRPAIGSWLFVVPVGIFLTGLYNTLYCWLIRYKRYNTMSRILILESLVIGIVSIGLGSINLGVGGLILGPIVGKFVSTAALSIGLGDINLGAGGLILGQIVGKFVSTAALIILFINRDRRDCPNLINLERIRRVAHRYRNHPYHLVPGDLMISTSMSLPVIILSSVFGSITVGFYSLAYRVITLPTMLVANSIADVYRQQANAAYQEKGEFSALFLNTLYKTLTIAFLPFLVLYFIAPDLFAFVFGERWRVSGEYAQIITIAALFQFVITPIDKGSLIVGATTYLFLWSLARLILTGSLFVVAILVKPSIESILWGLVSINSLLYLTEMIVNYRLSRLKK